MLDVYGKSIVNYRVIQVNDTKICVNISGKEALYKLIQVAIFHWYLDIFKFYLDKLGNLYMIFGGSPSTKYQNMKNSQENKKKYTNLAPIWIPINSWSCNFNSGKNIPYT